MSREVSGNTRGLASAERKALERLLRRSVPRSEFVSLDLAREVYQVGVELRRRVGVLITREGQIEGVCVGTKEILYLPDLGRLRLGKGRLRGVRLVFSDLSEGSPVLIPPDIITDLEKLRLDAVVAVKANVGRDLMSYAHLVPQTATDVPAVRVETVRDIGSFHQDFRAFIRALEDELAAVEAAQHVALAEARAVLVGVYDKRAKDSDASMAELEELAATANVIVLDRVVQRREADPRTVLGKGKLEEVVLRCMRAGADLIIFDTELRPSQWRAITNSTELKVLDRSMLILDIFAQRASSSDGRLQVELAQLKYNLPRLVEKDAGLSRLTGGIGGRGPGETKLEIGRRRTRDRIIELEKRIDKLGAERHLRKSRRHDVQMPLVAIVGYTNVGKSTLFNALTGSHVVVENKLFATLDPTHRRLHLPSISRSIVLTDTVGFIRKLPEELVTAFRATLEELYDAVLILHVIDASDPGMPARKAAVEKILADMRLSGTKHLLVANKADLLDEERKHLVEREFHAQVVSGKTGEGLPRLVQRIADELPPLTEPDRAPGPGALV